MPEGRVPLYLNPGLTFGTGSHASTQLCLEGVEEHTRPGDRVLDLGCGSGILSIAALCLGAGYAAAVDIDPKAVDVPMRTPPSTASERTGTPSGRGTFSPTGSWRRELGGEKYPLVLANIVADVIIPLSRLGAPRCSPRTGCSCAPALSRPGPRRWPTPWHGTV